MQNTVYYWKSLKSGPLVRDGGPGTPLGWTYFSVQVDFSERNIQEQKKSPFRVLREDKMLLFRQTLRPEARRILRS